MDLVAYNLLGRGVDMSGFVNGVGVLVSDPSVQTTFLGALDASTLAYAVSGATWSYMTVSGTATYDYVLQQYTGDITLSALRYYAADGASVMASVTDMDLHANLYDLGAVNVATMFTGDDFLWGNDYADHLRGGYGNDTLWGENGNDILNGEVGNDHLSGDGGKDTLFGGSGDDVLAGKIGADVLFGGSGVDLFLFDSAPGSSNIDVVKDFSRRDDFIGLDDDVFRKLPGTADGKLLAAAYYRVGTAARDGNDYLVYNPANDRLSYDSDGSGPKPAIPVALIVLSGNNAPAASDFLLFS